MPKFDVTIRFENIEAVDDEHAEEIVLIALDHGDQSKSLAVSLVSIHPTMFNDDEDESGDEDLPEGVDVPVLTVADLGKRLGAKPMTGIPNDADLELQELWDAAVEEVNETCRACGDVGNSITVYISPSGECPHFQVYECLCGHNTIWQGRKRLT